MGMYGASIKKPTFLYSNSFFMLDKLHRKLDASLDNTWNNENAVTHLMPLAGSTSARVSGNTGLKSSQAYPVAYGHAVRDGWVECRDNDMFQPDSDAESISDDEYFARERIWQWGDADFAGVCKFLGISADRLLLQ